MKYLALVFLAGCSSAPVHEFNPDVIDAVCKRSEDGILICSYVPVQTVEESGVIFDD